VLASAASSDALLPDFTLLVLQVIDHDPIFARRAHRLRLTI